MPPEIGLASAQETLHNPRVHEVGTSAVRSLLGAARRAGIEAAPALAAAGFSDGTPEKLSHRIGWESFHEFVHTLEGAANGRFDAIVEAAIADSRYFKTMIGLFAEPSELYRFVTTRYLPAVLQPLRVAFEAQPSSKGATEDAYRVIVEIAAPHRSSAAVLRGVGALLRAMPRALGLAAADVTAESAIAAPRSSCGWR